ncbi:hypothetical protein ACHAWF_017050 [Thalassiosira exigua]
MTERNAVAASASRRAEGGDGGGAATTAGWPRNGRCPGRGSRDEAVARGGRHGGGAVRGRSDDVEGGSARASSGPKAGTADGPNGMLLLRGDGGRAATNRTLPRPCRLRWNGRREHWGEGRAELGIREPSRGEPVRPLPRDLASRGPPPGRDKVAGAITPSLPSR